ncbi:N-acetylmuramoyl-L-alanine amidase [Faecalicatena contorta]|uniref:N-acetylmuramoyl-L-alanine amidase n=1 Tax=Faecalicatena contorta TaxID=39482 RepID=UPI0031D233AF
MDKKKIRGIAGIAVVLAVAAAGVFIYSARKPERAAGKQVMAGQVSRQASSQTETPKAGAEKHNNGDTSKAGLEESNTDESNTEESNTKKSDPVKPDTQEPDPATEPEKTEDQIIIALDPGHQGPDAGMMGEEEDGPGSGIMKAKTTSGTAGRFTGLAEYQLNLDIAKQVKACLAERDFQVVMTRENHETSVSNQDRAKIANESGAELCVRIHANGSESPESAGALCLVMSPDNPYAGGLYEESFRLAEKVLNSYCAATGIYNRGVQTDDTMTGINWSQVPVIILEMGFMTNQQDDTQMADPEFQQKMAEGIANGIASYIRE